jgi:hypothetical protein
MLEIRRKPPREREQGVSVYRKRRVLAAETTNAIIDRTSHGGA